MKTPEELLRFWGGRGEYTGFLEAIKKAQLLLGKTWVSLRIQPMPGDPDGHAEGGAVDP